MVAQATKAEVETAAQRINLLWQGKVRERGKRSKPHCPPQKRPLGLVDGTPIVSTKQTLEEDRATCASFVPMEFDEEKSILWKGPCPPSRRCKFYWFSNSVTCARKSMTGTTCVPSVSSSGIISLSLSAKIHQSGAIRQPISRHQILPDNLEILISRQRTIRVDVVSLCGRISKENVVSCIFIIWA